MTPDEANAAAALQPGETPPQRTARLLAAIEDGTLAATGLTRLDLSGCGLSSLPAAIGSLTTLEFLNLGGNPLSSLPDTFSRLVNLRILFFLRCDFTVVPEVLGRMPSLYMLSFKANRVREVPAASLSPTVGWLILSDNQIESLPASIGRCVGMRKLLLAGNRLTDEGLPAEMAALTSLELVRLADNRLTKIPEWVLTHPTLAWVALAANPATDPFADDAHARAHAEVTGSHPTAVDRRVDVPEVPWDVLGVREDAEPLGRGASGAVYSGVVAASSAAAGVAPGPAAVKVYNHGAKTSDGRPQDEMAASVLASRTGCRSIVRTTARFARRSSAGISRGLVMEYLHPEEWRSLGGPPSFDTVTRDVYPAGTRRTVGEVRAIARGMAAAGAALHAAGVHHGDLYAHNVLFREERRGVVPAAKLSDFGAAFFYPPGSELGRELERAEVRAYGVMLEEALAAAEETVVEEESRTLAAFAALAARCVGPREGRPSFADIAAEVGAPEGV